MIRILLTHKPQFNPQITQIHADLQPVAAALPLTQKVNQATALLIRAPGQ